MERVGRLFDGCYFYYGPRVEICLISLGRMAAWRLYAKSFVYVLRVRIKLAKPSESFSTRGIR